ncbi:MAG: AAA family ATPase [Pseudomonadota bacterium]
MYLKFFGLNERPFSITPDIQYLYLGKQHERALDMLMYGVKERMGFLLLTGEVGAGKTTLSRALLSRLDSSIATALLVNPLLSVPELLKAITKDFGIPVRYNSPQKQIDALNRFLIKIAAENRNALVVVDEAQNLSNESLEALRMLTNLETDKKKLLQILLVGQPELQKRLSTHELRQLDQRITTRCHLMPLTMIEMMRYINHRISIAGGSGKIFFESKAYKLIYVETRGYPRLINLLCDRALMSAFVRESYIVDRQAMKAAIADWKGRRVSSPWQFFRRLVFS